MTIKHAFVSPVSDSADATEVRPSNWNADHTWLAETADPGAPVEGQIWVVATGTSPTRVISLKIRDGGVTRTITSMTY